MAVIIERLMAEDLDLGTQDTTKTHQGGGTLNGHQISLSSFSTVGAAGQATTKAWTPGTVANASQATTTVAVNGATQGDKVSVSLSSLVDPLVLTGVVTAAGVVTVILANLTGGPVTVGAGTLSVLVFKHR